MRPKSRIEAVKLSLVGAIKKASETGRRSYLFIELQNIVRQNSKLFQGALPETVRALSEASALNVEDVELERSAIDLETLARHVELRMPTNGKGLAELIDSIFRDLFWIKLKKQCSSCHAPEMNLMITNEDQFVSYCNECYFAGFVDGKPLPNGVQICIPKKSQLRNVPATLAKLYANP
jgi:hypothetical protein